MTNIKSVSINVESAKTSELVSFYNEHCESFGKRVVKKFVDRATAELRVRQLLDDIAYAQEQSDHVDLLAAPLAAEDVFGYETHGKTNCPACGIHLCNGVGTHDQEVNGKKVKHEKFMFACLACGAEFGPAIPAAHEVDEVRSAAIAESWKDPETKAARSARHPVIVDDQHFKSVRAAFVALGLPLSKHIRFRGDLVMYGEQAFGDHTFKLADK